MAQLNRTNTWNNVFPEYTSTESKQVPPPTPPPTKQTNKQKMLILILWYWNWEADGFLFTYYWIRFTHISRCQELFIVCKYEENQGHQGHQAIVLVWKKNWNWYPYIISFGNFISLYNFTIRTWHCVNGDIPKHRNWWRKYYLCI